MELPRKLTKTCPSTDQFSISNLFPRSLNIICVVEQGLSEAKMELRRKEHAIRQVSKQMSYMESEKNTLMDRLSDAEKTMTAAARLLTFCYVSLRNLRWNFRFYLGFSTRECAVKCYTFSA